ncbi:MAG: hypothetical protein BWK73_31265, partial [Thiothrix lacustris]
MQPIVPVVAIGKVTYLLGQAEVTNADGSVSPLAVQMEIPDGGRIHVKKRSRLNLLMVDGGSEKLGPDTVFTFNKYTYDPNDPQATEIRKTLQDGEVTSTTGRGGDVAKERYRLNSPLAAIGVLGTEYTVKVSKGETWVTVHSGEISIAKLGGSCQRSGLGACAGGERLSEGQRGLALVVRANEPKPVLMPATAIPASETKAETPPPPVQEAETASVQEPEKAEKSEQTAATEKAISEKPTEPEAQKSSPEPLPIASASQPDTAKQPEHTSSTAAAIAAPPLVSPAPVVEQPPVVEKSSVAVAATDAGHSLGATFVLESADASFTANTESATPSPETPVVGNTPVVSNTKAKQSLVQSSNSASTAPVSAKVSAVPAVTTTEPVVTKKSTVESAPTKSAVPKVTTSTPVVVTPVVAPPVTEKPAVETVVVTPEKPTTAVVTATPVIASELPMPTVNWGKFDPVATVDGKTSFGEQVDSSYTQ